MCGGVQRWWYEMSNCHRTMLVFDQKHTSGVEFSRRRPGASLTSVSSTASRSRFNNNLVHQRSSSGILAPVRIAFLSVRKEDRLTRFPGPSISFPFVYTSSPPSAPTVSAHWTALIRPNRLLTPAYAFSLGCYCLSGAFLRIASRWVSISELISYASSTRSLRKQGGCFLTASWTHSWHRDLRGILQLCPVWYDSNMWITRLGFYSSPTSPLLICLGRQTFYLKSFCLSISVENVTNSHCYRKLFGWLD